MPKRPISADKGIMTTEPLSTLDCAESEVVIGLVSAVGTNDRLVQDALEDHIKKFGYKPNVVRLSSHLKKLTKKLKLDVKIQDAPEEERISSLMDAGDKVREKAGRGDLLALIAVAQISKQRKVLRKTRIPQARPKTAHILVSFKHPMEVVALRRIYGPGFFLVGVFAAEQDRLRFLQQDKNIPASKARELIERDQKEDKLFGQQTRDTFHLSDVFVRMKGDEYKGQLWRFLDLIFGDHEETPTQDEKAMFLAYAASLRSASLSRQVGATIVSSGGEVIGVGCNDVPRAGGGLYWPGEGDQRDLRFKYKGTVGVDSNDACRDEIVQDIMNRLKQDVPETRRLAEGKQLLRDSPLMDITEYGRSVHAEMEAILSCARSGISLTGGTLYGTTFPCHNCTRHIVAAGIRRVVYVEPYPKSRARDLHHDSISLLGEGGEVTKNNSREGSKVKFDPFVGIGPRRYFDLFSLRLSTGFPIERKSADGQVKRWDRDSARLRVPMLPTSYLQRERLAVKEIARTLK